MTFFRVFLTAGFILLTSGVYAEDQGQRIEANLKRLFGDKTIQVRSYDDQLNEIIVGSESYFSTHDGRFVFAGQIFDTHRQVDIVAEKENQHRRSVLAAQPRELFVHYPAEEDQMYEITVFTDIDCPYCRKFHTGMQKLNELGVRVNYVMIPRAGVGSSSYIKTLSALCSKNPADSITQAMRNVELAPKSCESTLLSSQIQLTRDLKIRSTPTIVLPSGELHLGFLSSDQLLALLEERRARVD